MRFLEMVLKNFNAYIDQYNRDKFAFLFNITLISFILIGLMLKYIISQTHNLTSDTVESGILSMEIFIHHNYFLTNFYLPALDPYYFTDTLPFQILPQLISNYNPTILKSVEFLIFCLTILVFSVIIYKISKNLTNALIFAAFISTLTPLPYTSIYDWPTSHLSTILFIGIVLLLLFDFPEVNKKNYVIALILLALIAFSDSIMIPWLVAPSLIYYFYVYRKKLKSFWFVCLSVIVIGIITFVKMNYIPILVSSASPVSLTVSQLSFPIHFVSLSTIQNNIFLFFSGVGLIYHDAFYYAIYDFENISLMSTVSLLTAFALLLYSFILVFRVIRKKFNIFLMSSGIVIFLIYILTDISCGIITVRYLSFFSLLIFAGIAISYEKWEKYFSLLLVIFLVLNIFSNITYIEKNRSDPNQKEFQLIDHLKANQLYFGFGEFWDANVNTYLSKESVIIRPVFITNGQITPMRWASAITWYNVSSVKKYFIISQNNGTGFYNDKNVEEFVAQNHTPSQVLQYKNYTIYVFNGKPPLVEHVVYHQIGQLNDDGKVDCILVSPDDGKGYALFGPYQSYPQGHYIVIFNIIPITPRPSISNSTFANIDVALNGSTILTEKKVSLTSLTQENGTSLEFVLPHAGILEFRVWSEGNLSFKVDTVPNVKKIG